MKQTDTVATRQQQKARTHQALIDAALTRTQEHGFAAVSLRQVSRDAGVTPAAFYRHFTSMEQLGLALVEQSFDALRDELKTARHGTRSHEDIIARSAAVLTTVVDGSRNHFAFIARERFGGISELRSAIRQGLETFVGELAIDLARLPLFAGWSSSDILLASRLFVTTMVSNAEQIVESPNEREDIIADVTDQVRQQLQLIVVGVRDWTSLPV